MMVLGGGVWYQVVELCLPIRKVRLLLVFFCFCLFVVFVLTFFNPYE